MYFVSRGDTPRDALVLERKPGLDCFFVVSEVSVDDLKGHPISFSIVMSTAQLKALILLAEPTTN